VFSGGFGYSVVGLLMNLYFKQLGFGEETIGTILSASSLGIVVISIPAAIIVDHMKVKRVLLMAGSINAAGTVVMALSSTVWPLRLMYGLTGGMFCVHWVAASPFFMRNSTPKERPYLFGVNMAVENGSGILGALLGGLVPRYIVNAGATLLYAYRVTIIAGVAVALISLVFFAMIKSEKPVRTERFRLSEYFGARDWRTVTRLLIPHFVLGMGAGLVIPFLNIYFLKRFNLDSGAIGRIFSLGALFIATGFLLGPLVAKRVGLVKTAVITQFLSIPFFLILAFSQNLYLSIVAFLFRGSLMNMATPMYSNFAMEIVPQDQHAGTNSVMSLAWSASWMVSAQVGGYIIQRYGFTIVMLVTVALYVTAITSAWLLFHNKTEIGRGPLKMAVSENALPSTMATPED
jgi:MFS family permease